MRLELQFIESMKSREIIVGLIAIICLGLVPSTAYAAKPAVYDLVWTKKANKRTGLYVSKVNTIADNLSLHLDGLYYYGDMEAAGISLAAPNLGNLGFGATINYHQGVTPYIKMRYSVGAGFLQGDNQHYSAYVATPRAFQSAFGRAAFGVEYYPIRHKGLYLYLGLALQYSYISYDIHSIEGNEHSVLPMIPFEIGYNFEVGKSWHIGVHAGIAQGLLDMPNSNLDAWPSETGGFGTSKVNRFADGYFQLGISLTYSWHECESCRLAR